MTAVRFLVWAAGAALCATLAIGATLETWPRHETAIITYTAAFAAISIGVVAWQLRPDTRIGILLTGWAFAGVLSDLQAVFRGSAVAVTVGYAIGGLAVPLLGQLVLSRIRAATWPVLAARPLGRLRRLRVRGRLRHIYTVFYDRRPQYVGTILEFEHHALPFTYVHWFDASGATRVLDWSLVPLALVFLALLARSSPGDPGWAAGRAATRTVRRLHRDAVPRADDRLRPAGQLLEAPRLVLGDHHRQPRHPCIPRGRPALGPEGARASAADLVVEHSTTRRQAR